MFKYYNYTLIVSNRSYSTEKIQKLLGIHPQTIREWVNGGQLQVISKKPLSIYGGVLKEFLHKRGQEHKRTLSFNEMKCVKCKEISQPQNNEVFIYHNKNGSIRAVGTCKVCGGEFSKIYKANAESVLKDTFFIKPTVSPLCNSLDNSSKTHIKEPQEILLSECGFDVHNVEGKTRKKAQSISSKTHIKHEFQQDLFNF